jgi:hypothetical protein
MVGSERRWVVGRIVSEDCFARNVQYRWRWHSKGSGLVSMTRDSGDDAKHERRGHPIVKLKYTTTTRSIVNLIYYGS